MKTTRVSLFSLSGCWLARFRGNQPLRPERAGDPAVTPATAQPVRQSSGSPIAVIDISRIFKEYPAFIDEMERLSCRVRTKTRR